MNSKIKIKFLFKNLKFKKTITIFKTHAFKIETKTKNLLAKNNLHQNLKSSS